MPSIGSSVVGLLVLATTNLAHVLPRTPQSHQIAPRDLSDFEIPQGAGGCSASETEMIDAWIDDVLDTLIPTAVDAITAYHPNTAQTLKALLGVDYDPIYNVPKDKNELQTIKRWFDEAHAFLDGDTEGTDYSYKKAWILCGDNYQQIKSPFDWAYDGDGKPLPTPNKNGYLRIYQVADYFRKLNEGRDPYWIPEVNAYRFKHPGEFEPGEPGSECRAARAFYYTVAENAVINICRSGPGGGLFKFGAGNTIDEVHVTEYEFLDRLRSRSVILLHETFHAIRPWDNDYAKNSHDCYFLAKRDKSKAQASPECLALFAAAMYFQTESANSDGWVFWRLQAEHQEDAWGDLARSPAADLKK
ncbi:hypothetical protein F4779DRAFT_595431 [Xylariaceae sp. FL0662B]|nr:hypothetical protein F4779DRAFT_595431 [Xylariaceae sp. FL0662B]